MIRISLIPKYHIKKFDVNNLYRLRLDRKRMCCYTILADQEGFKVIILEAFHTINPTTVNISFERNNLRHAVKRD
ncbi:hypothetical protein HXY33_05545 [Candidatus Bathyarchaeota archaeon]|nr:hypothetical protein [Candidatus Bathyarchaeota archaeon]